MASNWTCEICTLLNKEYTTNCSLCNSIRPGYELFVDNNGDPVSRTKDKVVITFGRFSPPTKGHKALFDRISELAKQHNADAFVFVLDCHGGSCAENPLKLDIRLNILKKMYPATNLKFVKILIKSGNNLEEVVTDLVEIKKYPIENIMIVEGSDRVNDFQNVVDNMFSKKIASLEIAEHALAALKEAVTNYQGKRITVLQAGNNRKNVFNGSPESRSATLVKKAALNGNIETFTEGVKIGDVSDSNIKVLMNEIRRVSHKDPIQGGTRKRHQIYRRGSTKKYHSRSFRL